MHTGAPVALRETREFRKLALLEPSRSVRTEANADSSWFTRASSAVARFSSSALLSLPFFVEVSVDASTERAPRGVVDADADVDVTRPAPKRRGGSTDGEMTLDDHRLAVRSGSVSELRCSHDSKKRGSRSSASMAIASTTGRTALRD